MVMHAHAYPDIQIPTPSQIAAVALDNEPDENGEQSMILSMGPQHPSTHGVLRLAVELNGENVVQLAPDVGFLHTGIEKTIETKTYTKSIVLTDRMDYLAPMSNNMVYVAAIEKLMKQDVPERAQTLRVLLLEITRINSHLVWLGTHALDLAAMSVFFYAMREREYILDIFEMLTGARMMTSYFRVGGLAWDIPADFIPTVEDFLTHFLPKVDEYEDLLTNNLLWKQRTLGVGVVNAADAIALGLSGANLRASGVDWDLRKTMPYSGYETYQFDVPVGHNGDIYDRYRCRVQEMRESVKIARQAIERLKQMHGQPYITDNRKVAPPPKSEITYSMESLIHHFKLWTEGFRPPRGSAYMAIESPRGEIGCYVVSDGTPQPWRVHFRAPSFINLQALPHIAKGKLMADLVALIASIDPVLGEVDR
ncbi:NADH dehydrogenase (quinone) subunit D [Herpetosiphon sp. NSE202]|uniref:NADH dehydrogenase (quinone) subunit D n=1 Tax=Herpetosiphon sp. NSE202 TaxID=3351349 RepID=UPI003638CEE4